MTSGPASLPWGLLLAGACTLSTGTEPLSCRVETGVSVAGDAAAYREGMDDPAACDRLMDADLRGECQAFAAAALAKEDPEAGAMACELNLHPLWGQECWFLLADARDLIGEEARQTCERAGRMRRQCSAHATARETAEVLQGFEADDVLAAYAAVLEVLRPWMAPPKARARAEEVVAQWVARRDLDVPFHRALCGDAGDALCAAAYAARLSFAEQSAAAGAVAGVCAAVPSSEAAAAAALPPWQEDVGALALGIWARRCAS